VDKKLINSDQYLREAIENEITILKKFNHPNIVKLEDMVITANSIYVITELCRNGDLKSYLRLKKPNEDESIKILIQLINGMREIVKQGIMHRDLKPANVLVHDGVFKICDFGFAKYFKEIGKMNRTCVGTPMYMSPQALKHKPYTNKADIWSLGIVFYEMLFAKTPWAGNAED
jgi:serine/threonine-protein kinase ULK/ATG1